MPEAPMPSFQKARLVFLHWLARRLPPCEEITLLVSAARDRKLTLRERVTLRLHLAVCLWCKRYQKQLLFLQEALHRHGAELEDGIEPSASSLLTPEARARIRRTLSNP